MDEEIKKLLEKNLELTREIREMVKGIKRYVFWQRVWGALKILIIVIPIVLGIIYLPALLKDVYRQYQNLLGAGSNGLDLEALGGSGFLNNLLESQNGGNIPPELQKYFR
ncbi:MAG: hypothetical protein PHQ42_05270 [Patescibacteria group bacterium]|nr:hypothetical protein [Patescibacteria group bacterium]